ncbi:MAG: type III secretion system chaperone [Pseudomonadota bacterium]
MSELPGPSGTAVGIIADLVRDHGLSGIDPKEDTILQVVLEGETQVLLVFADDICFMHGGVAETGEALLQNPWLVFNAPNGWADRRTRLAVEPETERPVLIRDLFLDGMTYGEFTEALAVFAEDVETAKSIVGPKKAGAPVTDGLDPALDGAFSDYTLLRP